MQSSWITPGSATDPSARPRADRPEGSHLAGSLTAPVPGPNFHNVLKDERVRPLAPGGRLETELEVAETVGRLMHFWGFKRPMGRAWTILYLSPQPLSAAELGERLSMSAGGISMTLSALEKWGCVERIWVPGERREYFRAEPDIWKMVQRVLEQRELSLVREFGQTLERARVDLEKRPASRGAQSADDFKLERLKRLSQLANVGEGLLGALVEGHVVDPTFLAAAGGRTEVEGSRPSGSEPAS